MTDDIQIAVDDATRTALEAAIRNSQPLPYFEEYYRADDAAEVAL